jgi:O-phosphoseryl-tRNA(Cys) synthetase
MLDNPVACRYDKVFQFYKRKGEIGEAIGVASVFSVISEEVNNRYPLSKTDFGDLYKSGDDGIFRLREAYMAELFEEHLGHHERLIIEH